MSQIYCKTILYSYLVMFKGYLAEWIEIVKQCLQASLNWVSNKFVRYEFLSTNILGSSILQQRREPE